MEQTRYKSMVKTLLAAVLTFVVTLAMIFALLPSMTLSAHAEGNTIDVGNISTDGEHIVSNGDILTGRYNGMTPNGHWIKIPAGATVTFSNMTVIQELKKNYGYPNFVCDGNATIILEGTNEIFGNYNAPCITVREGYTLTIKGSGILKLEGENQLSATPAIGAPFIENGNRYNAGNIVFESGTIIAKANSNYGYGIGGFKYTGFSSAYSCGDITIKKDATVTAIAGANASLLGADSGIGGCGTITVNGYVLTDIESTFNYPVAASTIIGYIEAIPNPVTNETSCKSAIEKARLYYDCTTETQQANVTNFDDLVAAELEYAYCVINAIPEPVVYTSECKAKIDDAKSAYNQLSNENKANFDADTYKKLTDAETTYTALKEQVDDAIGKIDAIGTVDYNDACKEKIDAARAAYDALDANQKDSIANYNTLSEAEISYESLKEYYTAADKVVALIENIGTVEYTTEIKEKIDSARMAYDALDSEQKSHVTNYNTLTSAEDTYAELKTDHEEAEAVVAKINAIGTVEYTTENKAKIDEARADYGVLTDNQKALVSNYEILTAAEFSYQVLKTEALIEGVGEVTYPDSKETIDEARAAYDDLTTEQQALVNNYEILTAAESTYKTLYTEALIENIGTVETTPECRQKIKEARNAYEDLTADQQALVDNYETLTAAEARYAELKKIDDVIGAINAIGVVFYNSEIKSAIDNARATYDALTVDQQACVTNYDVLTAAESTYTVLKTKALIDAIGEVSYTPECKAKIDAAQDAFNGLNEDQKNRLNNSYALVYALQDYQIQEAIALINAIGEVEYTAESKEKIEAAKAAYNTLTPEQKALVSNYSDLIAAEQTYEEKEVAANKGLSDGAIAGIVIGSVFLLLVIACAVLVVLNKKGITHIAFVDVATEKVTALFKKKK